MAYRYETKKVVAYYHNGKKVLQKYHKINGVSQLVYSAFAYGGYIKNGLVLQLDCSHYNVASGWFDEVSKTYKTIEGLSVETDGGIKFSTSYTFEGNYVEVCLKDGDSVTTSTNATIASNSIVYEVRVYNAELTSAQKAHNAAIDQNFSMPDGAFCLADGTAFCLADGTFFVNN